MVAHRQSRSLYAIAVVFSVLCVWSPCARAVAPGTGWEAASYASPTNLPPGGKGFIQVDILNIGAAPSTGSVTMTDTLPPGVTATAAGGLEETSQRVEILGVERETALCGGVRWVCSGTTVVSCTSNPEFLPTVPRSAGGEIPPSERLGIAVDIAPTASGVLQNRVAVSGGGAPETTSVSDPMTVNASEPGLGFAGWDTWFTNADGPPDTQAG